MRPLTMPRCGQYSAKFVTDLRQIWYGLEKVVTVLRAENLFAEFGGTNAAANHAKMRTIFRQNFLRTTLGIRSTCGERAMYLTNAVGQMGHRVDKEDHWNVMRLTMSETGIDTHE